MRRHIAYTLGATGVIALALAGCSSGGGVSGTPTAVSGVSDHSSSPATAPSDVPKVARPLDPSAMLKAPCSALSTNDLGSVNVTEAKPVNGSNGNGPLCTWGDKNATASVGVSWDSLNKNGLADQYSQRDQYSYFFPTTIAGYPAVRGSALDDERAKGNCEVSVGVTDHLTFTAMYLSNSTVGAKSCDLAAKVAADVIHNLGGGS